MTDLIERLRSNEPLPVCPFDRLSPHYWTMPDDKPCPICGQENTLEGPDKCRGADTRVMKDAADEIDRLRGELVRKADILNCYRRALVSIAANTCCDRCQEASLVAQRALSEPLPKLPGHDETMANLAALSISSNK